MPSAPTANRLTHGSPGRGQAAVSPLETNPISADHVHHARRTGKSPERQDLMVWFTVLGLSSVGYCVLGLISAGLR